jgi:hypothetical protein
MLILVILCSSNEIMKFQYEVGGELVSLTVQELIAVVKEKKVITIYLDI